jgi:hypothetical protein
MISVGLNHALSVENFVEQLATKNDENNLVSSYWFSGLATDNDLKF